MKKLIQLAQKFSYGLGYLSLFGFVYAQTPAGDAIELGPPAGWTGLEFEVPALITAVIQLILVIAALISFIFLIIGGIKWIVSGGDKAATESARNTITAALIGLMIVFSAWAIAKLIETFFGITILTLTIPKIGG